MTRAELLELLKKARKQLKKYHVPKDEQTVRLSIDSLENALSEQQHIVRCKDCKYAFQHWNDFYRCDNHNELTIGYGDHKGNWFCADGERKDSE